MFSVIIPWMYKPNRVELLHNVLNRINIQNYRDFEVIIPEQIQELKPTPIVGFGYNQFTLFCPHPFNKSWLMNVAARRSTKDYLVFMDADTLFGPDFFSTIVDYINNHQKIHTQIFFCWNRLQALPGKDNPNLRIITPSMTVAMGGIWCVEKKFYLEQFRGMNETFFGYGGEDNDAYDRASYLINMPIIYSIMHYELVHQYHDWEKAHENAADYSYITRKYPKEIQERLNNVELGKLAAPTPIEMDDLRDLK